MQPPTTTKNLVGNAVQRAQRLVTKWPNHFPTLLDAEKYVGEILGSKDFCYAKLEGNAPRHIYYQVCDRTHHIVALEAYRGGAFKLDKPPTSSDILREAISEGVKLAISTIKWYPYSFPHINAARNYVRDICKGVGLCYNLVEGVHPAQVALYVHFQTAVQAWESGRFTLDKSPQMPKKRPRSDSADAQQRAPSPLLNAPRGPLFQQNRQVSSPVTAGTPSSVSVSNCASSLISSRNLSRNSSRLSQTSSPLPPRGPSRVRSPPPSRTFLQQLDDEAGQADPRESTFRQQQLFLPDIGTGGGEAYPSSDSDDQQFYGDLIDLSSSPALKPVVTSEDTVSYLDPFDGL